MSRWRNLLGHTETNKNYCRGTLLLDRVQNALFKQTEMTVAVVVVDKMVLKRILAFALLYTTLMRVRTTLA